jgi:hypothetical protein
VDRGSWTLAYLELPDGTSPYDAFLRRLNPYQRVVVTTALETILAAEGTAVCQTEWGKSLGGGLYEFRIRRSLGTIADSAGLPVPPGLDADRPVLIRVFFTVRAGRVIVLLGGFDKQRRSSASWQDKQIRRARALLKESRKGPKT